MIIVNPSAGRSRGRRRWLDRVVAELHRLGCAAEIRVASAVPGSIEALARKAPAEFDVLAAAGGDGTINALVNGCAGSDRPIALLPLGTANVLAREIGMPHGPAEIAALIATGRARDVWPGKIGNRLFLVMASSGFDADIVAAVNPVLKRWFGRTAFAWAILIGLVRYRRCELQVEADGAVHRASSVIATRTRLYAGPFIIAPEADLGEPALHLLLFRRAGRAAALAYLLSLISGGLPSHPEIQRIRAGRASISARMPVPTQADGEVTGNLPLDLGIAERPIRLICP